MSSERLSSIIIIIVIHIDLLCVFVAPAVTYASADVAADVAVVLLLLLYFFFFSFVFLVLLCFCLFFSFLYFPFLDIQKQRNILAATKASSNDKSFTNNESEWTIATGRNWRKWRKCDCETLRRTVEKVTERRKGEEEIHRSIKKGHQ